MFITLYYWGESFYVGALDVGWTRHNIGCPNNSDNAYLYILCLDNTQNISIDIYKYPSKYVL